MTGADFPSSKDDGAVLLDDIATFVKRFIVLSTEQNTIIVLWIILSHVFNEFEIIPYLSIQSAEKRCGKSRLLELLSLLVNNPWLTGRTSTAALVRKIADDQPTVLLDESDTAFNSDRTYAEALRGILNHGFAKSGQVSLCVGKNTDFRVKDFPVFCPKAIAGIGTLPDTIADRSIQIRLDRRKASEAIDRFRFRSVRADAAPLRNRIQTWAAIISPRLSVAAPALPEELDDRAQDIIEPLLAIAQCSSAEWKRRAWEAAVTLCANRTTDDESRGIQLLKDIRAAFLRTGCTAMPSIRLAEILAGVEESPWILPQGGGFNPRALAKELKRFKVGPKTIRFGAETAKGYHLDHFRDVFARYIPEGNSSNRVTSPHAVQPDMQEICEVTPVTDVTENSRHSETGADQSKQLTDRGAMCQYCKRIDRCYVRHDQYVCRQCA